MQLYYHKILAILNIHGYIDGWAESINLHNIIILSNIYSVQRFGIAAQSVIKTKNCYTITYLNTRHYLIRLQIMTHIYPLFFVDNSIDGRRDLNPGCLNWKHQEVPVELQGFWLTHNYPYFSHNVPQIRSSEQRTCRSSFKYNKKFWNDMWLSKYQTLSMLPLTKSDSKIQYKWPT